MSMKQDPFTVRRKRLAFRAWHRGTREMDFILGTFADRRLETLDNAGLGRFEALIDVPDQDLYNWITSRAPVPEEYDNDIMGELRSFRFEPEDYLDGL